MTVTKWSFKLEGGINSFSRVYAPCTINLNWVYNLIKLIKKLATYYLIKIKKIIQSDFSLKIILAFQFPAIN